jgi:hypothetical protein
LSFDEGEQLVATDNPDPPFLFRLAVLVDAQVSLDASQSVLAGRRMRLVAVAGG